MSPEGLRPKAWFISKVDYRQYLILWRRHYYKNAAYGVCKAAVERLSADTAYELKDHGVAVFSLYPGQVSTENMVAYAKYDPSVDPNNMETPQFIGRCVAALALEDKASESTGKILITAEIAERFGITDIDGRHPRSQRAELW